MDDLISRHQAIDEANAWLLECLGVQKQDRSCGLIRRLEDLPSAQPERLTDDDFETIRIHLNACKEKLCNQRRWKEAEEYQRIIDRFMAFASAQPEIVFCKQCNYYEEADEDSGDAWCYAWGNTTAGDQFCSCGEKKGKRLENSILPWLRL